MICFISCCRQITIIGKPVTTCFFFLLPFTRRVGPWQGKTRWPRQVISFYHYNWMWCMVCPPNKSGLAGREKQRRPPLPVAIIGRGEYFLPLPYIWKYLFMYSLSLTHSFAVSKNQSSKVHLTRYNTTRRKGKICSTCGLVRWNTTRFFAKVI